MILSEILSLSNYKISTLINLFKSYNIPCEVFHEYFLPNKIQTPSMTISTIAGGLLIVLKEINPYF